ncbi:MAG: hypothetical protein RIR18_2011 [Pseudomonadota bacterium]|jgi:methyl-accepting chemotaxis protein
MEIKRGITLKMRLITITVVTILALSAFFGIVLYLQKAQLMSDRQDKVRNLVEAVYFVADHFHQAERQGKYSEQEAKTLAMGVIRQMRYEADDYFWINGLDDRMIMHPIKPALDGTMLDKIQDKNGKFLFVEFNRVVQKSGSGFVDYVWPKPGAEQPVPKLSYVKGFQPWGWVIGSGIYIDDVEAKFRQSAFWFVLWGILIGGFIAASLAYLSRNILKTLGGDPELAAAVTRSIAAGDLTCAVPCAEGDNTSLLASIQSMVKMLHRMIAGITSHAEQVASAANQLLHASEEVADHAQQQSDAASTMASCVEEMAVSIGQVRENANEAHVLSQEAGELSKQGTVVIHNATAEMQKISTVVQTSSAAVEELGQQSQQITSIVNTIREIADQTNLLALNAAIEAARAGEQGRGFAVVADEVRKLAERTSLSTTEIAGMVSKIQTGTKDAVGAMKLGVEQVASGMALASQAGTSIDRIRHGANQVTTVVNDINTALAEQSSSSQLIARQLEQIAQMSEESALSVQHTAAAAKHLQQLSSSLHGAVSQFKT